MAMPGRWNYKPQFSLLFTDKALYSLSHLNHNSRPGNSLQNEDNLKMKTTSKVKTT